ncbi:MAG: tetratricopeptide repeat protein [Thermoplasmata archaeon]
MQMFKFLNINVKIVTDERVLPSLARSNDEYMAASELLDEGLLEEAEKHARKSLEIKESIEALILLIEILEKQGKDSFEFQKKLIESYPANPETYRRLFLSNFDKNKDDALSYINKAITIMRKGIYYYEKSRLLISMERDIEALASIDQAIKLENRNALFWNMRGTILMKLGRFGDAKESEDVALKLDPRNRDALLNLAKIYISVGDKDKARETLLKIEVRDQEVNDLLNKTLS